MIWYLILGVQFNAPAVTQIGPFASEAACEAAGKKAQKRIPGNVTYLCVANDLPHDK